MQITSKQKIKDKFKEHYLISLSTNKAAKKTAETLGIQEDEVLRVIHRMTINLNEERLQSLINKQEAA